MSRFKNKIAIVTGAGQGVGYACAEKFIKEGATVIGVGRTKEKLEKAQKELGKSYVPFTMDVGSIKDWEKLVAFVKKEYGEIDYLVNNAASSKRTSLR